MPVKVALGAFDGLHAGHARLFAAAGAPFRVLTFKNVPGKRGGALYPFAARVAQLRALRPRPQGVDWLDLAAHNMPADAFLRRILARYGDCEPVVGADFRFGSDRRGADYLRARLPRTVVVPRTAASSSAVKLALREGRVSDANALLLTPYFREGVVSRGAGAGRELGFPTANIPCAEGLSPLLSGVYAGIASLESGDRWPAAVFCGRSETFGRQEPRIEAHLPGFRGELYGQRLRVEFHAFVRPAKKFAGQAELAAAIGADVQAALRALLAA